MSDHASVHLHNRHDLLNGMRHFFVVVLLVFTVLYGVIVWLHPAEYVAALVCLAVLVASGITAWVLSHCCERARVHLGRPAPRLLLNRDTADFNLVVSLFLGPISFVMTALFTATAQPDIATFWLLFTLGYGGFTWRTQRTHSYLARPTADGPVYCITTVR